MHLGGDERDIIRTFRAEIDLTCRREPETVLLFTGEFLIHFYDPKTEEYAGYGQIIIKGISPQGLLVSVNNQEEFVISASDDLRMTGPESEEYSVFTLYRTFRTTAGVMAAIILPNTNSGDYVIEVERLVG